MKVLYFSEGYTVHDHRFLSALSKTEHKVIFLKMNAAPPDPILPRIPEGIRVYDLGEDRFGLDAAELDLLRESLGEIFHEAQPDVVHAGPVQPPAYLTTLAGFSPLLTMSWGSDILADAKQGENREIARQTLKHSTLFLCDCQAVAEAAIELGMPEDRIVVFPWGVALDRFARPPEEDIRGEMGWDENFVMLSTRALEPRYGVEILLNGFIQVARNEPRLRLLILGQGSLRQELDELIKDHVLADRVHFVGTVAHEKMPDYFQAADLYVAASRVDGSSISLLQAMASGLPSLVSDIPGNKEWIKDSENGWLFADGDPDAFASVLLGVLEDESGLEETGRQARSTAETRADWRVNFQRLLEAYDQALNNPRKIT